MTSDTTSEQQESKTIPVTLKWNKRVFSLPIHVGESGIDFKRRVAATTGVPLDRQKLMAKKGGGWKGPLKDDTILDASTIGGSGGDKDVSSSSSSSPLVVTLIGSAETLARGPTQKTIFIEDLAPEELQAAEHARAQEAMVTAEGMIPALQLPPHHRDDHKQELYQYNRLVQGLPQRQIERELQNQTQGDMGLQGKVAMTLGLELRRAYINDLTVLQDGTCVSALDDGHVQLWKHGAQRHDVVHAPGGEGGVDSVVALQQHRSSRIAFATAGRGRVQFWSAHGDSIISLSVGMPGTTPSSLVAIYGGTLGQSNDDDDLDGDHVVTCLAARCRVTRRVDTSRFHLAPQTEEERQRRAYAEAQEQVIQQNLARAERCVHVFYSIQRKDESSVPSQASPTISSKILNPSSDLEGAAPVTCLTCCYVPGRGRLLVAGDTQGGLRLWQVRRSSTHTDIEFAERGFYQMASACSGCSIVSLEPLKGGRLAVATDLFHSRTGLIGAAALPAIEPRAVHILDLRGTTSAPRIQSTLTGHSKDAVICMCQLPDGGLLTGGGKLDATLQLWSRSQVDGKETQQSDDREAALCAQPHKVLSDVGYVFALAVLTDAKDDSNYYAVAAGRYNTIKIIV